MYRDHGIKEIDRKNLARNGKGVAHTPGPLTELERKLLEAYRNKYAVDGGNVPTPRIWDAAEHYKWSLEIERLERLRAAGAKG